MEETAENLNPSDFQPTGNSSEPLIAESSKLNSSITTSRATTLGDQQKKQREEFDKIFSHIDVLDLMLHAFQCELPECQDPDCHMVKEMYRNGIQVHGKFCTTLASGAHCDLCPKMWYFLGLHSKNCNKEWCYVPQCRYLKDRAKIYEKSKSLQTYQQQLLYQQHFLTSPSHLQTYQHSMQQAYQQRLESYQQPLHQESLKTFPQPLQTYQQSLHTFQQPLQTFQHPNIMRMQSSQTTIAGSSNQTDSLITNNQANYQANLEKWRKQKEEFNKKQSEEFDKIFSHRDVLDLLLHAFRCELPQCQDPDCILIKEMYSQGLKCHGLRCTIPNRGGCDPCTKLWYFLRLHAQNCKKECCYVPHCGYFKHGKNSIPISLPNCMKSIPVPGLPNCMKSIPVPGIPYRTRSQQLLTFPAMRGVARKRAAEATPGTADTQKKSQKISINSIPSSSNPFTTSTSLTETLTGSHQFKITGYSLLKGLGLGKHIASEKFDAGGYKWAVHFYPDGKNPEDNAAYVSCFIALSSEGTDVRALFELALLDQSGKEMHKVHSHFGARTLENGPYMLKYRGSMWGYKRFYRRTMLEMSDYLKDDCLIVQCKVGVVKSHTEGSKTEPPPEDNGQQSGELLEREQATEAVVDKMGGHLSVAEAVVDKMEEKEAVVDKMDEKEVVVDKMHHLSIADACVLDTEDEHHRSVDDEWTLI